MRRGLVLLLLLLGLPPAGRGQVDWRFGWEDTWAQLGGFFLTPPQAEELLSKMQWVMTSQQAGGDVNVNGLAGGWNSMQPNEGDPIFFGQSDFIVRRLQAFGFSLQWEIRLNSLWASVDNPDCYDISILTHCGPGSSCCVPTSSMSRIRPLRPTPT